MWIKHNGGPAPSEVRIVTCDRCHGTRTLQNGEQCRVCRGLGVVIRFGHVELRNRHEIPAGEEIAGG